MTDKSELAKLMLVWEATQKKADEIAEAIKDAVLQVGATVVTGNVTARYSGGRKSYDYKQAVEARKMEPEALDAYKKVSVSWDYRMAALQGLDLSLDDIPFTTSAPSVSLKIER